jgi:hypothetical protein
VSAHADAASEPQKLRRPCRSGVAQQFGFRAPVCAPEHRALSPGSPASALLTLAAVSRVRVHGQFLLQRRGHVKRRPSRRRAAFNHAAFRTLDVAFRTHDAAPLAPLLQSCRHLFFYRRTVNVDEPLAAGGM